MSTLLIILAVIGILIIAGKFFAFSLSLVSTLIVPALIIIAVQRQYDPPTFFRPAEGGFNSLARRLQYIQSKLGIESYEFEFATSPDEVVLGKH